MAQPPYKKFRCPPSLTKVLLLQVLLIGATDASDVPASPTPSLILGAGDTGVRGNDVYLDLTLNGSTRGVVHFVERDGELWAGVATLKELGFILSGNTTDPVRLKSLAGLQVNYDVAHQSVTLTCLLYTSDAADE